MTKQTAREQLVAVADDLHAEGEELYRLLRDMDTGYWTQESTFKAWTVWDVLAHLHVADYMALMSLKSPDDFHAFMGEMRKVGPIRDFATRWLNEGLEHGLPGPDLLEKWWTSFASLCDAFRNAEPDRRYVWAGPDMKARMLATARLMETWAHGWEVYDLMGVARNHTDRLKNVATIGVRTYGWTFANRKLEVPEPAPYVKLTAPSGAIWEWGDPDSPHRVEGSAVEFCQVVTQVRNIQDTMLTVSGDNAHAWMNIAQCFAGPPEDPPAPGTRAPA
jgi:uncharacterized protein (TIGR03084 family)